MARAGYKHLLAADHRSHPCHFGWRPWNVEFAAHEQRTVGIQTGKTGKRVGPPENQPAQWYNRLSQLVRREPRQRFSKPSVHFAVQRCAPTKNKGTMTSIIGAGMLRAAHASLRRASIAIKTTPYRRWGGSNQPDRRLFGAAAPRSLPGSSGRYGRRPTLSVRFFPNSEATPTGNRSFLQPYQQGASKCHQAAIPAGNPCCSACSFRP